MAAPDEQYLGQDYEDEVADIEEFPFFTPSTIETIQISVPPPTQFGIIPSDGDDQRKVLVEEEVGTKEDLTDIQTEFITKQPETNKNESQPLSEQTKSKTSSLGNPIGVQSQQQQNSFSFEVQKETTQKYENYKKSGPTSGPKSQAEQNYSSSSYEKKPHDHGRAHPMAKRSDSSQEINNVRNINQKRNDDFGKGIDGRNTNHTSHASRGKVKPSPHKQWKRNQDSSQKNDSENSYQDQKMFQAQKNIPQACYEPKTQNKTNNPSEIVNYPPQISLEVQQAIERAKIAEEQKREAELRAKAAEEQLRLFQEKYEQKQEKYQREQQQYQREQQQYQQEQQQYQQEQQQYQQEQQHQYHQGQHHKQQRQQQQYYEQNQQKYQNQPTQRQQRPSQQYQSQGRQQDYPPQVRQQDYTSQGRQQDYPPQGRQQDYPPQGRQQDYPPQGRQQDYPPQVRQQDYPPQVRQQDYTSQGRQQDYTSQRSNQQYQSQGRQQNYPPQGRQQDYTSQGRQQDYTSQGRQQDYTSQSYYQQQTNPPTRNTPNLEEDARNLQTQQYKNYKYDSNGGNN